MENGVLAIMARADDQNYTTWHKNDAPISTERYDQLSSIGDVEPPFSEQITGSIQSVPFLTAKMYKAPIGRTHEDGTNPFKEVHYELSGAFKTSLGGNLYAANIIEPNTGKTDVYFLKAISELWDIQFNCSNVVIRDICHK